MSELKKDNTPRCDRCNNCEIARSKKHNGMTDYCTLLNYRDVGQSTFGHNSPKVCPLRNKKEI